MNWAHATKPTKQASIANSYHRRQTNGFTASKKLLRISRRPSKASRKNRQNTRL